MAERTVAAIATPNAAGGIGIVRISGGDALSVASKVFVPAKSALTRLGGNGSGRTLADVPGYTALFGTVVEATGEAVDQAICLVFRAPASYTGEDVVELQCHGGMYLMQKVLRLVLAAGAEPAGPGEFTKRAFLNGKLDLSEAESVMNMISAHGEQAANAAYHALEGSLSREIRSVSDVFIAAAAHMAAWADYPDEIYEEELDYDVLLGDFRAAYDKLDALTKKFDAGQAITEGVETAIVGRPNVGKSTLMNRLLQRERSIVTSIAGTTRDVVEETARIGRASASRWQKRNSSMPTLCSPSLTAPSPSTMQTGRYFKKSAASRTASRSPLSTSQTSGTSSRKKNSPPSSARSSP